MTGVIKQVAPAAPKSFLQTLPERPVLLTLLCTFAILVAFQIWRPYFFLTDDNLNHSPVLIEAGRNLMSGKNPYISQYLNEGNFSFLREPSVLHLAHPVLILISGILSLTPWQYIVVDVVISLHFLISSAFTTLLYLRLRERYQTGISNWLIVVISLSSTFSIWAMIHSSSAGMYIFNQATLSIIFIGLIHQNWKYGSLWIGVAVANALLASHAGELAFTLFFVALFTICYCLIEKSWTPLISLSVGGVITLVLVSPYIYSVVVGLMETRRTVALPTEEVIALNFVFPSSIVSFFTGPGCLITGQMFDQCCALNPYIFISAPCCFASWLLIRCRMPIPAIKPLAWCFLAFAAFTLLVIDRPIWLQEGFLKYIPLVKSLRWPYKELMIFVFFIHLWMIMVPPVGTTKELVALLTIGTVFWLSPFVIGGAPSISLRHEDRTAVTSGAADRYWNELKKQLPEDVVIIPAMAPNVEDGFWSLPQSAFGSYFYGALYKIKTPFYYSPTKIRYHRPNGGDFNSFGVLRWPPYLPANAAEFPDWMRSDPKVRVLRALSAFPFRIELINPSAGTIEDVTPIWQKALSDSNAKLP